MPHVLKALWSESIGAHDDGTDRRVAAGEWKHDLSWLGGLEIADVTWSITGVNPWVSINYRGRLLDVALAFHVVETDEGWTLRGPATYW